MEGTTKTITGKLRVMQTANKKLYAVEVMALNAEVNRNNWQYINLAQHLNEFLDIPILTAYVAGGLVIGDGHNMDMRRDPRTGEEYASFTAADAERIVGWIPKDPNNVRLETVDGIEWVIVKGYLWAFYAKELVDQIARQGGSMDVSIETLVLKEHQEGDVDVEEEYLVLGITILGNGVAPAVAGANIRSLAELTELRSNMAENILKAASYIGEKEQNEPKNNDSKKGVTKLTYLNRKQLQALGVKFPDYKAIGGAKDDSGIHLCLMAKDGSTAIYTMETENDTIAPEKLCRVNALANFSFGENCNLEVDVCEMTDALSADLIQTAAELEQCQKDLQAANATIEAMRNAENVRRVSAAKAAAKAELADFNANRAIPVEDSILDPINADIDAGVYTERCNAEGKWVGEDEVINRVKAACADAQKALDKKNAEKKETTYIWDKFVKGNSSNGDDFDSVLARMQKSLNK